ncbi:MAG: ABC transporter permease [Bacteroidota bacterium]
MNLSKIFSYALRVFNRSRVYSAINLLGLSLGLAVFTLIVLFVRYEFGYDRYHANADRIYRITREDPKNEYLGTTKFVISAALLADGLKESVKDLDHVTRIARQNNVLMHAGNKSFFENETYAVDPAFFDVFTLDVIAGPTTNLLTKPTDAVLAESVAIKYFGSAEAAVGKTISGEGYKSYGDFMVQAVIRDMPFQSHFRTPVLFPFEGLIKTLQPNDLIRWGNNNYWIYFTLQPGADVKAAEEAFNAYYKPQQDPEYVTIASFQPLADVYLGERMNFDLTVVGNKDRLYIFMGIGILVLVIACINYINMSTARAANRAKEIGVRKVNGALRLDLVVQFLAEAFLSTAFAAVIAIIAVVLILPGFNEFLDKQISLDFLLQPQSLMSGALLLLTVAIVAGAYPAFLFSSFKPINTLKGRFYQSHNSRLRNVLVVFQFVVSGTLVFGTLIVWKQMEFVKNKDLGFNREHIIVVPIRDRSLVGKHEAIREELLKDPSIKNVSASRWTPTGISSQSIKTWQTKNGERTVGIYHNHIDANFIDTYGMTLVAGSNLTPTSRESDVIVNETLVKQIGYTPEEAIGQTFLAWGSDTTRIVGVVKDFHFQGFNLSIEGVDFRLWNPWNLQTMSIKVDGNDLQASLAYIKTTFGKFSDKYPFEYTFYDDLYAKTFISEAKTSRLMTAFSSVAIIIAALGLYGLILHMVNQRMKEIGIRKTLGAGSLSIIRLLSGKFGVLILIGYMIASVVGYYGVQQWLSSFAYRVSPTVLDFAITLFAIGMIAAIAVYSRIATALRINPATVLKQD